jgi:hypothetical protein
VAFDLKRLGQNERAIVGGGAVVFVAGFLPWWGYNGPLGIYGPSVSGWSAGFSAWAGTLLLTLAGVYVVLRSSEVSLPSMRVGPAVLVAGAAALGLFLVVVRWLTLPRLHGGLAGSIGAKYGIWLAMIAGVVELAAAIAALRASGEPLPWAKATDVPDLPGEPQA